MSTQTPGRLRTVDVARGHILPDLSYLDAPATLARKREVERQLGAMRGTISPERSALVAENEAIGLRLGELREREKRTNARRNFAGLGSPLHEALVARLDAATVAGLEADALALLDARERRNAERKASKG